MTTLKEKGYVLQCASDTILGLLYVDNTALLAHDEDNLGKSLNCLVELREEWGVGINVSKCGIMHMRKKIVEESKMSYSINVTIHGKRGLLANFNKMRLLFLCTHQTFLLQFMYISVAIATSLIKYTSFK